MSKTPSGKGYRLRYTTIRKFWLPIVLFAVVALAVAGTNTMVVRRPRLESISPAISSPGETVTLKGRKFGYERGSSHVAIGESRVVGEDYVSWKDREIIVKVGKSSGLIVVHTKDGSSKGKLFSNAIHLPRKSSDPIGVGRPYIMEVNPSIGSVGTLITIAGLNFGGIKGKGEVLFSYETTQKGVNTREITPTMLVPQEIDYDYKSWSDQKIQVFLPDGATTGELFIQTDRGISNPAKIDLLESSGERNYIPGKRYEIIQDVEILGPVGEGELTLWIPSLFSGPQQRGIEWESQPEPLWDHLHGVRRYQLYGTTNEEEVGRRTTLRQTYSFHRYEIQTRIISSRVEDKYNSESVLYSTYTSSDGIIKLTDEIEALSSSIVRRQPNPYTKAKLIYEYLIRTLKPVPEKNVSPAKEIHAIDASNSFGYSYLFCALSRATGVPSRPLSGYLVYEKDGTTRVAKHYWGEFYLEGFGWVQVDPFLGEGFSYGTPKNNEEFDPKSYYFGSIDANHILFSKGVTALTGVYRNGSGIKVSGIFEFQTMHEESKEIESYRTFWGGITVKEL